MSQRCVALPRDWAGEEKPVWWPSPLCWAVQGLLEATPAGCGGKTSGKHEIKVEGSRGKVKLWAGNILAFSYHTCLSPIKLHLAPQNSASVIN